MAGGSAVSFVEELVAEAELSGIRLRDDGDVIKASWPPSLTGESVRPLLERLRQYRPEVAALVRLRASAPPMPKGVRLLTWKPKQPPVALERCSVVTDTDRFARATLADLGAKLADPRLWIGWSEAEMVDRLWQVGVEVVLEGGL